VAGAGVAGAGLAGGGAGFGCCGACVHAAEDRPPIIKAVKTTIFALQDFLVLIAMWLPLLENPCIISKIKCKT
jgi:hypothetical protein